MSEWTIYALKVDDENAKMIHASLKEGEGRFGWSYIETANLQELKSRIEKSGWDSLTKDEKECYQSFLLELKPDDYVVYINVPKWGHCTLARVTAPYYWKRTDEDFSHRFGVDPESVKSFDRNDAVVRPALSARLKLQGRWWHVYAKEEFEQLLEELQAGKTGKSSSPKNNLQYLSREIKPLLAKITEHIHHTHPNYSLEHLVSEVLKAIPGVREVKLQGGAGDRGADILVVLEQGHPLTGGLKQITCVVQVKAFEGEHWDTQAVKDIRRAFATYRDADVGLILSTAEKSSAILDSELEKLRTETGKQVDLLIGDAVALFILKYGSHLLV